MSKPYAFVQDIAASWPRYLEVAPPLTQPPEGVLVYAAGPSDEGVRVIGVWQSRTACERFRATWLNGVIASLADPAAAERTLRDLTPAQLLIPAVSHPQTDREGSKP
jgi:hypothetical protein